MSTSDAAPDGMAALSIAIAEQRWPQSIDAAEWAKQWMQTIAAHPNIPTDEATMLGWFANAIMAGYDTATARLSGKPYEALGFAHAHMCVLLDEGKDPRHEPVPDLIDAYRKAVS